MTNFTIVRATPNMVDALSKQFAAWDSQAWQKSVYSWPGTAEAEDFSRLRLHTYNAREKLKTENPNRFYLAYKNGALEGVAEVEERHDSRKIMALFSNPENLIQKKKSGVGIALIQHLVHEILCREEPVPLTVTACSVSRAARYYTEKCGFAYSWDYGCYVLDPKAMQARYLTCGDRFYYAMISAQRCISNFFDIYKAVGG